MFVAFHRLVISGEVLERRSRISPGEGRSRDEIVNTIWMLSGDHAQRRRFLKSRADRLIMIRRMVARRARVSAATCWRSRSRGEQIETNVSRVKSSASEDWKRKKTSAVRCGALRRKVVEAASGRRQVEKPWETNAASPVKGVQCNAVAAQCSRRPRARGENWKEPNGRGRGTYSEGDGANKEEDGLGQT